MSAPAPVSCSKARGRVVATSNHSSHRAGPSDELSAVMVLLICRLICCSNYYLQVFHDDNCHG